MEQMADSNSSSESSLCSETALNEFGSDDNDEGVVAQQGIFVNQRKPIPSDPDSEGDEDMVQMTQVACYQQLSKLDS